MLKAPGQRSTREQTRQRILAKTEELVRYYGFAKTTVADIAAALEMSPANIYKFFPSKDALIEATAERKIAEVRKSLEDTISASSGALARLEGLALTISLAQPILSSSTSAVSARACRQRAAMEMRPGF